MKKSFSAYTKNPFLFVWGSLMYVFMLVIFFFAALGLLLVYFIFLSLIGQEFDLQSIPTIVFLVLIGLVFMYFTNGLNAALARTYHAALWREKTTITAFYSYALERAPLNFAIQLLRDLIWVLLAGPVIAIYVLFLTGVPYMDAIVGLVILTITFVIHMVFTPALITAGAFEAGLYSALRHGFNTLRRKHIMFIGLYFLFAIVWLLNFIPFIQLVTIFFLYPIIYSSMVMIVENAGRPPSKSKKHKREEED
ncbi:Uncharacterised protein [Candidatus Bilamarchaeum dharawalense]|uniref:Uncharacterized protein n=1 Tax=Candidatus Bilamarchaeum dharawalense TaxID=2885759 RepID=A0A5E4LS68_9ARCH|nr:Uncharacterised protein [Candidatus Bilamarchaeum dharawalense]